VVVVPAAQSFVVLPLTASSGAMLPVTVIGGISMSAAVETIDAVTVRAAPVWAAEPGPAPQGCRQHAARVRIA
jgi:hypothetical protein